MYLHVLLDCNQIDECVNKLLSICLFIIYVIDDVLNKCWRTTKLCVVLWLILAEAYFTHTKFDYRVT